MKFGFLLLILMGTNTFLYGQNYYFKNLTTEDGLPSNEVYSVTSDKDGYLWFCTDKGVAKYDGTNFKIFNLSNGLNSSVVFSLNEDSKGKKWLTQFGMVVQFIHNDSIFDHPYKILNGINYKRRVTGAQLNELTGKLLIDDGNRGYHLFYEDSLTYFKDAFPINHKSTSAIMLSKNEYSFHYHLKLLGTKYPALKKEPTLLLYNKYTLTKSKGSFTIKTPIKHKFHKNNNHEKQLKFNKLCPNKFIGYSSSGDFVIFDTSKIIKSGNFGVSGVISVYLDKDSNFFLGSRKGCYLFEKFDLVKKPQILFNSHSISSINRDYQGGYWFTSLDNGVYLIPNLKVKNIFTNQSIVTLKNRFKKLYIATGKGEIYSMSMNLKKSLEWREFRSTYDKYPFEVMDKKSIKISGGKIIRNNKVYKEDIRLNTFYSSTKDIVAFKNRYLAVGDYGAIEFNSKGELLDESYSAFKEFVKRASLDTIKTNRIFELRVNSALSLRDNVFLGTESGLYIKKGQNFIRPFYEPKSLTQRINTIIKLDETKIALGTAGNGVMLIEVKSGNLKLLRIYKNLIDLNINALCFNDGILYIGTNKGMNILKFKDISKNLNCEVGVLEGLSKNISTIEVFGNQIWAGTNSGLAFFTPKNINPFNSKVHLIIDQIRTKDTTYRNYQNTSELVIGTRSVTILVRGINFAAKNDLFYKYHLKGFELDTVTTTNNSVRFAKLSPGTYTFEVWVKSNKSKWSSTPKTISFTISKYFWETWWFRALVILTIGFIAFLLIKKYNQNKRKTLMSKLRNAELKQKALTAMMSPHFINNSLSAIQNLINKGDIDNSNEYISRFALLVRQNLNAVNDGTITIADEIERLELYLCLEKLRFGNNLTYSIVSNLDSEDAEELSIPSMIIQPFIENAIWHGILPQTKGHVEIKFEQESESLIQIKIIDNGVGMNKTNKKVGHKSLSMEIISQRLKLLSEETLLPCNIQILSNKEDKGTTIAVNLPISF